MPHVLLERLGLLLLSAALNQVVVLTHQQSAMCLIFTQALITPVTALTQPALPLESIVYIARLAVLQPATIGAPLPGGAGRATFFYTHIESL